MYKIEIISKHNLDSIIPLLQLLNPNTDEYGTQTLSNSCLDEA
jgi:hypothetical protein